MGSHTRKKKHDSDSSSSESEDSSSEEDTTRSKRNASSSDSHSVDEKSHKPRKKREEKSHRESKSRRSKVSGDECVEHKYKERGHRVTRESHSHQSKDRSRSRSPKERKQSWSKDRYGEREREDKSRNRDDGRGSRDDDGRERDYDRDRGGHRRERGRWDEGHGHGRRRRSRSFDHANARWGKEDSVSGRPQKKDGDPKDKEKPNFGLSGKLTEETNTYKGVVIKYSEPPEARKPRRRWRLYPFKGEKALQTLYIHRESAYLIGRDRKVVDLPVDHPSCSKQHAVLQYRLVPFTRDDGSMGKRVRPYIIDLDSANGTFINNKKIDPRKYIELLEKDVIKFGYSSREYVLLHENSKDEGLDDDVKMEEEEVDVKLKVKSEPE